MRYIAKCVRKGKGIYQHICEILRKDTAPVGNFGVKSQQLLYDMLFKVSDPTVQEEYRDALVSLHEDEEYNINYLLDTVRKGFKYQSGDLSNEPTIVVPARSRNVARDLVSANKSNLEACFGVTVSLPNGTKRERKTNGSNPGKSYVNGY